MLYNMRDWAQPYTVKLGEGRLFGKSKKSKINTFDYDGVINLGHGYTGVKPCENDIIVTGKPISEYTELRMKLNSMDINNHVIMNPISRSSDEYGREASGKWKAKVLTLLKECYDIGIHFEDDPIQIEEIRQRHSDIEIVYLRHGLVER